MAKTAAKAPVLDENALNIFTDGSSYSNPRRGGFAFRIVTIGEDGHEVCEDEQGVGHEEATNQEMELLAPISALEYVTGRHSPYDLSDFSKIVIYTDSQYVQGNYNHALYDWPGNGWCGRDGEPVVNAALWKRLVKAIFKAQPKRVNFEWVKGHKASEHNKAVDKLAKKSANAGLGDPLKVRTNRRKTTDKKTEVGSIECQGQRLMLRIVGEEYLEVQRIMRYRCEVVSRNSPYFRCMDWLTTHELLRANHIYSVRLSDGPPKRIAKVFREVERKPKTP